MYGIAIIGVADELNYWTGDPDFWSADAEIAARFYDEAYAQAALITLKGAIPNLSETAHVVELPELEEDA
jgi:hypothetical protein